jgi:hypothetical protein
LRVIFFYQLQFCNAASVPYSFLFCNRFFYLLFSAEIVIINQNMASVLCRETVGKGIVLIPPCSFSQIILKISVGHVRQRCVWRARQDAAATWAHIPPGGAIQHATPCVALTASPRIMPFCFYLFVIARGEAP